MFGGIWKKHSSGEIPKTAHQQFKLSPEELLARERRTHPLTCERDHIDPIIYSALEIRAQVNRGERPAPLGLGHIPAGREDAATGPFSLAAAGVSQRSARSSTVTYPDAPKAAWAAQGISFPTRMAASGLCSLATSSLNSSGTSSGGLAAIWRYQSAHPFFSF